MNITVLDAATLGEDVTFEKWEALGNLTVYKYTSASEVVPRLKDSDIAIINKVKMTDEVIKSLPKQKSFWKKDYKHSGILPNPTLPHLRLHRRLTVSGYQLL